MTLQTWGPPTTPPVREPLVVPVDPARGWRAADAGRRTAAVLALPLAALMALAATSGTQPMETWALYGWALVGPACFYSLARVLRPEPRSAERTPRHLLAGAATSFAVPVLAVLSAAYGDDEVVILLGTPAAVLGALTLTWGLAALVGRASRR